MNTFGILEIDRGQGKLWRVVQFPVTRFVAATAVVVLAGFVLPQVIPVPFHSVAGIAIRLLLNAVILGAYVVYVRVIERRGAGELGLPGAPAELGLGFAVGMLLFAATLAVLWVSGVAHVGPGDGWGAVGYSFVFLLPAAVREELLLRGVLFRIVEESLGSWWALAISAAIFGALHLLNPGATVTSGVAISLEAGVLLALVYLYTRRLWMAIGLHAAWNFTEGGIFGSTVSGNTAHGLLRSTFSGPALMSGGRFGPEGSIVAVLVCFAASAVFLVLARQRGHLAPPIWRRRRPG